MNEFEELVMKMRRAQKDYFAKRSANILMLSKSLEREVDKHLENINNPKLEL